VQAILYKYLKALVYQEGFQVLEFQQAFQV
jgi:hypothetical protein